MYNNCNGIILQFHNESRKVSLTLDFVTVIANELENKDAHVERLLLVK